MRWFVGTVARTALRYRVADGVGESIDRAHTASLNYLSERGL